MQNETKKPCGPEAGGRERAEVFRETDPLCAALDELCAELTCWYEVSSVRPVWPGTATMQARTAF